VGSLGQSASVLAPPPSTGCTVNGLVGLCDGAPGDEDAIPGTAGADAIDASQGDTDIIKAFGGADFICVSDEDKVVQGGPGDDKIGTSPGSGNKRIKGQRGEVETLQHDPFGSVEIFRSDSSEKGVVVFVSGAEGWPEAVTALATVVAELDYLVVGKATKILHNGKTLSMGGLKSSQAVEVSYASDAHGQHQAKEVKVMMTTPMTGSHSAKVNHTENTKMAGDH